MVLDIVILINLMLVVLSSLGHRSNSHKDFIYKVYIFNIATIVLWVGSMIFDRIATEHNAVLSTKILYSSATLIAGSFYYFSLIFPKSAHKYVKHLVVIMIVNIVLVLFIMFSHYIIQDATIDQFGEIIIKFGLAYFFYILFILYLFCSSFFRLFVKYRNSSDKNEKAQLFYIFLGYTVSGSVALFVDLLLPWMYSSQFCWLGPTASICLALSITYAVKKYRLFNIQIIAVEVFVFVLWVFTLIKVSVLNEAPSADTTSLALNVAYFILVIIIGIVLIRSVEKEVRQRERNEELVDELTAANAKLKEVDELKTKFVSLATHQMASPLTSMKVYSEFLKDGGNAEAVKDGSIGRIADNFISIVKDFLDISKLEAGETVYTIEDVDMRQVLAEVLARCSGKASEKGIQIKFNMSEPSDVHERYIRTKIDKDKFAQALQNIFENSVKYSERAGYINVELAEDKDFIYITIRDKGIRILPSVSSALIKKFSSSGNKFEADIIGNSLGLYAAKQIIERMGGSFDVTCAHDVKGCNLNISLRK